MPRQNNPILPEVKHKENTRVIVTKLIANAKKNATSYHGGYGAKSTPRIKKRLFYHSLTQ